MDPVPENPATRRRVWRWVLIGAAIFLTPFVVLGVAAVSYLTLDRDVAVLRSHVMDATGATWNTKVQMSVGGLTLGAVGQGLRFVHEPDIEDARLALSSVKHASVGVYERASPGAILDREQLFVTTDKVMQRRGWTRLVGVSEPKENVLIYVPSDFNGDGPVELYLAVVNEKELVVLSTTVDAAPLMELAMKHGGKGLKGHLALGTIRL